MQSFVHSREPTRATCPSQYLLTKSLFLNLVLCYRERSVVAAWLKGLTITWRHTVMTNTPQGCVHLYVWLLLLRRIRVGKCIILLCLKISQCSCPNSPLREDSHQRRWFKAFYVQIDRGTMLAGYNSWGWGQCHCLSIGQSSLAGMDRCMR